MVVEPRTWELGPTHTIASGNEVSFIVKFSCVASATGNAIPSFGGRLGRLPSPATCWATVAATAMQSGVGSSLTTSVRCWVPTTSFVFLLLEQATKKTAHTASTAASRRTSLGLRRQPGDALFALHAEAVQREGDHVIVTDEHRQLDKLSFVVALGEGGPRRIGDAPVLVELVGGREQHALEGVPTRGIGPGTHAVDLLVGDAHRPGDQDVLAPFVGGPAVPPGAEDQQLTVPRRQLAHQQLAAEREPLAEQPGMADEGVEDVRRRAGDATDVAQQLSLLLVPLIGGQRRDAGCSGPLRHRAKLAFQPDD